MFKYRDAWLCNGDTLADALLIGIWAALWEISRKRILSRTIITVAAEYYQRNYLATEFEQESSGELFDKLSEKDKKISPDVHPDKDAPGTRGNRKNCFSTDARNELSTTKDPFSAHAFVCYQRYYHRRCIIYIYIHTHTHIYIVNV